MKTLLCIFALLFSASSIAAPPPVTSYGKSIANSTTSPLGSSETFTGEWELTPHSHVMVSVKADSGGMLFFDFSPDGINSDSTHPKSGYTVSDGVSTHHVALKGSRYFRVRFVNDSTAQTYLRMIVTLGAYTQDISTVSNTIARDADAIVTRVIDPQLDLALGRIEGISSGTTFGRNPEIDTSSAEDLWNGGGDYTGHPVGFTPETVTVSSSSALDTLAGDGARTVRVIGLKTNLSTKYEFEDIALNGTSGVISVNSWWRVNRAYVLTAGSDGANVGVITVNATTTTANVFVSMGVGFSQSTILAYTVPYGSRFIAKRIRASISRSSGAAGAATISIRYREAGGVYRAIKVYEIQTGGSVNYTNFAGDILESGSDIKIRIDSVSDNDTEVDAAIEYILIEE